jgi:hypothetical protein
MTVTNTLAYYVAEIIMALEMSYNFSSLYEIVPAKYASKVYFVEKS